MVRDMLDHPSNARLATATFYTADRTPAEICLEIATPVAPGR